jgi:hypothetical protein
MGKFQHAFAWKIKEDLLPNSTTVSDLKLRVVRYYWTTRNWYNNDFLQQYNLEVVVSVLFGTVVCPLRFRQDKVQSKVGGNNDL